MMPLFGLDIVKACAIVLVVLLHVIAPALGTISSVPLHIWWAADLIDSFARVCVPLFVMVSGATILHLEKFDDLGRFFTRRFQRVLVPLLLWSSVYFAFRIYVLGEPLTVAQMAHALVGGQPYFHLYFLYFIMGLYLAAPVLVHFTDRART